MPSASASYLLLSHTSASPLSYSRLQPQPSRRHHSAPILQPKTTCRSMILMLYVEHDSDAVCGADERMQVGKKRRLQPETCCFAAPIPLAAKTGSAQFAKAGYQGTRTGEHAYTTVTVARTCSASGELKSDEHATCGAVTPNTTYTIQHTPYDTHHMTYDRQTTHNIQQTTYNI